MGDSSRWYSESSEWMKSINEALRARPESGPFDTDLNNPDLIVSTMSDALYRED